MRRWANPTGRDGRKRCFFKKKKQKTSVFVGDLAPALPQPPEAKVFCFFFFKKEALAFPK
jgi:hypothetical protein